MCVLLFFTLDAGLLAVSQYSEGPATGHLDTGFSWFHCICKQMLRWFARFQVYCASPKVRISIYLLPRPNVSEYINIRHRRCKKIEMYFIYLLVCLFIIIFIYLFILY